MECDSLKYDREKGNFIYQRPSHLASLERMRSLGVLCDVTIHVEDKSFQAHKIILASSISYFEKMFSSNFEERDKSTVKMIGITSGNMKVFIDFAYTGVIVLNEENIHDILKDADFLDITDVREECIKLLPRFVSLSNIFRNLKIAEDISYDPLKKKCSKIIRENFIHISKISDDFLLLDPQFFQDIISCEELKYIPRILIFEVIMRWIMHHMIERQQYLFDYLNVVQKSLNKSSFEPAYILEDKLDQVSENEYGELVNNAKLLYEKYKEQNSFSEALNHFYNSGYATGYIVIVNTPDIRIFHIFDIVKEQWVKVYFSIKLPECQFSGHTIHNDKLYIIDGMHNLAKYYSSWIYDFQADNWKSFAPPSEYIRRWGAAVAVLGNSIYKCGGYFDRPSEEGSDWVERFCLETNQWEEALPMNCRRINPSATTFNGCIYVVGGHDGMDVLNSVERYDPRTDQWTNLSPMHNNRYDVGSVWFDGKLYVCGGYSEYSGGTYDLESKLDTVEYYDPVLDRWEYAASMRTTRCNALLLVNAGKIWAIGDRHHKNVEIYDPEYNKWTFAPSLSEECQGLPLLGFIAIPN